MNVFSCRYECPQDHTVFIVAADKSGIRVETTCLYQLKVEEQEHPLPDTYVEFYAKSDVETLLDIMRGETDLHVAIQTLRPVPIGDNSMERDYNVEW